VVTGEGLEGAVGVLTGWGDDVVSAGAGEDGDAAGLGVRARAIVVFDCAERLMPSARVPSSARAVAVSSMDWAVERLGVRMSSGTVTP